jgi:hypothetical protein
MKKLYVRDEKKENQSFSFNKLYFFITIKMLKKRPLNVIFFSIYHQEKILIFFQPLKLNPIT